ncbi:Hypothetical protein NTJ_03488 [Nesidiocoris tenuis]|uniref:SCP domain-containing protein n=1 Tax=Nesidiocoris tenuis TaxID=355587 RepID=A0ABN7AEG8_9HEMI|nr:Hypothetical protein NTJ_03488 [Nesidiocoris tenuis]
MERPNTKIVDLKQADRFDGVAINGVFEYEKKKEMRESECTGLVRSGALFWVKCVGRGSQCSCTSMSKGTAHFLITCSLQPQTLETAPNCDDVPSYYLYLNTRSNPGSPFAMHNRDSAVEKNML